MNDEELNKIAEEIGHKAYDYYDVVPEFLDFILKRVRRVRDECQKEEKKKTKQWQIVAREWMNECDALKKKYEPLRSTTGSRNEKA